MTHGKDWMVGASTCSVGKATPEVVRAYAEAGLDAMEISLKAHEYAALDLPALRRAADETGLTIWSLHLPFSNECEKRRWKPISRCCANWAKTVFPTPWCIPARSPRRTPTAPSG